ncbi:hypothetical protein CVT24_007652 [Panaeolus cyanescens]|uniref:Ankyrin n=1 Tax=Panaeolus cyanescens TaxID=181874 RepID=A0A409W4T0_9AGAR|nr:hypothetical protein CVT24_007652 [Panaeolus cyanescens]
MQSSTVVETFLSTVGTLQPGQSLDPILQPALDYESDLRKLFASDRQNGALSDRYVGLVDVFKAPDAIKTIRARSPATDEELNAKYVMPLTEKDRKKDGTPCIVPSLEEFQENWSIFTEGSLSQLKDWNNVVAAGGSVLACLMPLDEKTKESKRSIRKHYHTDVYPSSDVDLFLWGLNAEQAEEKIKTIYKAVRDSVPWDVTCIRTKHTVSIHSQYPYRSVQIVLRLYQSPAEILAGFDVDVACCAYDSQRVWANPRAIAAIMRQCNTVDITRRSPSYEVRLSKYAKRGYEVYVPNLERANVDPTIYERSIVKMEGLARLLVLEKITDVDLRYAFLEARRSLRGRPSPLGRYNRYQKTFSGDLKANTDLVGLAMNDYDVVSLHIPYGPGWDARRIEKLVYQTDLGMNSTFNPKNKGRRLHRHPAFFGTVEECMEDGCDVCPEPIDDDEKKLQEEEDEKYIRGRIKFIEENPGRQSMTGSFNPIDDGEWSEQAYIKPTQKLFAAIAAHDRNTVRQLIAEGIDFKQRDHVGRTCLHLAIITKAIDIARDLIDAGARITARLVDGKTPLHLAAQHDLPTVVDKLFEKNAANVKEEAEKNPKVDEDMDKDGGPVKGENAKPVEKPSSEDDWSSHTDEDVEMVDADGDGDGDDDAEDGDAVEDDGDENWEDDNDDDGSDGSDDGEDNDHLSDLSINSGPEDTPSPGPPGDMPEDQEDEPDIIDPNVADWDFGFTALSYAVLYGSIPVIDALINGGADPKLATKLSTYGRHAPLHPLSLTLLRTNEDEACNIAEHLNQKGASTAMSNKSMWSIFHSAVAVGRPKILMKLLSSDPHAKSMLNFPAITYSQVLFPVVTAIEKRNYAALAILLANDVKLDLDNEDITRAIEAGGPDLDVRPNDDDYRQITNFPFETALANFDDVVQLLLPLGVPINLGVQCSHGEYAEGKERRTILDYVRYALHNYKRQIKELETPVPSDTAMKRTSSFKAFLASWKKDLLTTTKKQRVNASDERDTMLRNTKGAKDYYEEVERLLTARGAKTWSEVYPDEESTAKSTDANENWDRNQYKEKGALYFLLESNSAVPQHLVKSYDQLYEACFTGNDKKVQELCLPSSITGAKNRTRPLNISVRVCRSYDQNYQDAGYTPLFAAVAGGHWATAKLILSIASAQYSPKEVALKAFKISRKPDEDDDDDENSDYDSDGSDMTVNQKDVKFIDIATTPSSVRCTYKPQDLLQYNFDHKEGERVHERNLLTMAIAEGNIKNFKHVISLYDSLPQMSDLGGHDTLTALVQKGQPDMLDEFIRRTGLGIDIEGAGKSMGLAELPKTINDSNKLYLGIKIHGKKRADLAMKNDPTAQPKRGAVPPLVWRAAEAGATGILTYLSSGKPLEAYQYYSSKQTVERAIWIKNFPDFGKHLPGLLGWKITDFGASPLTSALLHGQHEVLDHLFSIDSKLMTAALQRRLQEVGTTPLLLAVSACCSHSTIDFLLSKSCSVTDTDLIRGWNLYHILCATKQLNTIQYLLAKLPRDVNEALLVQQSKSKWNTPLHIAVKSGAKDIVKTLLEYSKTSIPLRDIAGFTVLHAAVKAGYAEILSTIIEASAPEVLYLENSVGTTVLEMATLAEMVSRVQGFSSLVETSPNTLSGSWIDLPYDGDRYNPEVIKSIEREIPRLREVVQDILPAERKKRRTKVVWEVNTFIALLESRVQRAKSTLGLENEKEDDDSSDKREGEESDVCRRIHGVKAAIDKRDYVKTLEVVKAATEAHPLPRQLVHVFDVQRSVEAGLKVVKEADDQSATEEDDLAEKEQSLSDRLKEAMLPDAVVSVDDDPW